MPGKLRKWIVLPQKDFAVIQIVFNETGGKGNLFVVAEQASFLRSQVADFLFSCLCVRLSANFGFSRCSVFLFSLKNHCFVPGLFFYTFLHQARKSLACLTIMNMNVTAANLREEENRAGTYGSVADDDSSVYSHGQEMGEKRDLTEHYDSRLPSWHCCDGQYPLCLCMTQSCEWMTTKIGTDS